MPWFCPKGHRTVWCHWCKVRHCACRPHQKTRPDHRYRNVMIRLANGQTRFMSSRRYAHLKGAQKGGQVTAGRPNPGRFSSASAKKAALARWEGRHRVWKRTGVRVGLPARRVAPGLNRRALRVLYNRAPRAGVWFDAQWGVWHEGFEIRKTLHGPVPMYGRIISERTALRRLGHLFYARKNWVPGQGEPIIKRMIGKGLAVSEARGGSK